MPLARTTDGLGQVLDEFRKTATEMAALRGELAIFKATVDPIVAIIRGDGKTSPITEKVALLQRDLEHTNVIIDENKDKIRALEERQDQSDRQDRTGRIGIILAIVSGLFGLIGTIVTAIVSSIKH